MKKMLAALLLIFSARGSYSLVVAGSGPKKNADLESELARKISELEACAKKTKNYKIAGGIGLGLTAVGATVNIAKYSKQKDILAQNDAIISKLDGIKSDTNSMNAKGEQMWAEEEAMMKDLDKAFDIQNIDKDKLDDNILSQLNDEEIDRLVELSRTNPPQWLESDRPLMIKIYNIGYHSQKD